MSLENIYTRFLASPREDALHQSATFHYITTAISVNGPERIITQLGNENMKALKKRQEKVIASIETSNSLVLEVATEIEFLTSGCNWLPGLDDNFLADMIVRFPVVCVSCYPCIVAFSNYARRSTLSTLRATSSRRSASTGTSPTSSSSSTLLASPVATGLYVLLTLPWHHHIANGLQIKDGAEQVKMIVESVSRQSAKSAAPAAVAPQQSAPEPEQNQRQQNQGQQQQQGRQQDQQQGRQQDQQQGRQQQQGQQQGQQLPHGRSAPPNTSHESDPTNQRGVAGGRPANNANSQTYSHFEFDDEAEVVVPRKQTAGQGAHQSSWGYDTPEKKQQQQQHQQQYERPSNAGARRNEGHSFEFGDDSPAAQDKVAHRPGKGDSSRSGYQWTQQKNAQEDDNGFFGGFGKEMTTSGIHIAGDGRGKSKTAEQAWSWDQQGGDNEQQQGGRQQQQGRQQQGQQQQQQGRQQDQQQQGGRQQQQGGRQQQQQQPEEEKGFWDY